MSEITRRSRVLLSTVSSDSHTWNLVFLQLVLEEIGCDVTNLGSCVPDEVIIESVRAGVPDAVVISSVNGHGHLDGARLIARLRNDADPVVAGTPALIGGKLGIHGLASAAMIGKLTSAGFNAVFPDGSDIGEFTQAVRGLVPELERPGMVLETAV